MDKAMSRCRYAPISTLGRFSALLLYPAVSFVTFAGGIYLLFDFFSSNMNWGSHAILQFLFLLFPFAVSLFLFLLGVMCYRMENRKYATNTEGIIVRDYTDTFYSWDQIYEIAIVAYGASASLQSYQTVICCFLKPPEQHFLSKILTSYIYGARNTKNFVLIDYSPSVANEFAANYPREISDYRRKQLNGKGL